MSEQEENIVLSICVPTYNQSDAVEAFLESAVPQLTPETEIIFWDDSRGDETENIVKTYASQRGNISYARGATDGLAGIDRAVVALLKRAKGKYVWTFGDDALKTGAVQKVLELVKKHPDINFIYINSHDWEDEQKTAFDFGSDTFFDDGDEVLRVIGTEVSFISATVFDRGKALTGEALSRKHIGSTFIHSYFVLTAIARGGRCYAVNTPYVVAKEKPMDFAFNFEKDVFKVYIDDLFKIVNAPEFKKVFDKRAIKKALAIQFGGIWRGVLVARARGVRENLGSDSPKIPLLIKHFWNYPEIIIAVPLLALPRSLDRVLYKIYKKIVPSTRSPRPS